MSSEFQNTPGQISIAGISQGALLVNTYQIKELTNQLQYTADCEALQQVINQAIQGLTAMIAGIGATQLDQLTKLLPLLNLPGANPFAILKWIKKLVFGMITPQLEAYILYTMQLIELAGALADLIQVVGVLSDQIGQCSVSLDPTVVFNQQLQQVEGLIGSSLGRIGESQLLVQAVSQNATLFDTSNAIAFTQSVRNNLSVFREESATFMSTNVNTGNEESVWTEVPTIGSNVTFNANSTIVANGAVGLNNQVLKTNGTSLYWDYAVPT